MPHPATGSAASVQPCRNQSALSGNKRPALLSSFHKLGFKLHLTHKHTHNFIP